MAIVYDKLLNWSFPDLEHRYTAKDTILYALGLGCGIDPLDRGDLAYVYEAGLKVLPSMAVVLGYPGFWLKDPATGADWVKVLHGEQSIRIHVPLAPSGTVIGRSKVDAIVDKGPGRGALLYSSRRIIDKASGTLLATVSQTTFLRGDGGFGGPSGPVKEPFAVPDDRAPDLVAARRTAANTALIYRLSGDFNPLHADPDVAAKAGFKAPILHGLASLGVATRALVDAVAGNDPTRLKALDLRFTAPVYPGETIATEIWRTDEAAVFAFRGRVVERDLICLGNGRVEIAQA
ncbi:3-alpha,7-alpha,12-alpha-trihydroxy-5-beta-cholest-24-enoyl-CoA hydratase [Oleomonas cavernae]|uniref:3-alpha,7-alpha, 12-alpha-trihydroxy-5-beta-cholest-24-enoyl-CoA hydratase n=1 Tax=Oleomonas cavernae TaxID=2320859 RepID=A0A418WC04_9PROT|nr:MaoC/PaaZ C-terminal domain-containing protein [Oleomonas cavernae]RJF87539.1 3-alpha,7-alpha,12-alpha-trihydroxy-5-beta-cholest-24-enoyl-CoA hydratase [Oleomonas cavernae]